MARPATGNARWNPKEKCWEARVTINGKRESGFMRDVPACVMVVTPKTPDPKCVCTSCRLAKDSARIISDKSRASGAVPEDTAETSNEWHGRYLKVHKALGHETRGMGSWDKWAGPIFGTTPMSRVTREQIIQMRDALGAARRGEDGLTAKRVGNLWSELVLAPFSRAFDDDPRDYREVRVGPAAANPASGVKPPVTKDDREEDKRERQHLYPREFAKLIRCEAVPAEWRSLFVVATYLFLRPEELYGLRWGDIDWEAEEVRVRCAFDPRKGEQKTTKNKGAIREVPIHPNLMPLLKAMRVGKEASARVVPLATKTRNTDRIPRMVRRYLKVAGIERTELLDGTNERVPFDFRSFRTTGCTWHAMLGTDSFVLARWAGHSSPDVTWGSYVKSGPDLRKRYGDPFPALPEDLFQPPSSSGGVLVFWSGGASSSASLQCEGGDLNPYRIYPTGT